MTAIKKGTEVWMFGNWDFKAGTYARRMIITSMGKKQGTAVHVENGKNIESRIYADDLKNIFAVVDMPDPTEEGMRRAVAFKARNIAHYVERAHWNLDASDDYLIAIKKSCEGVIASEPNFRIL